MRLVENWQSVVKGAWSFQLSALNTVAGSAYFWFPALQEYVSPMTALIVMAAVSGLAALLRPVKQRKVSDGQR